MRIINDRVGTWPHQRGDHPQRETNIHCMIHSMACPLPVFHQNVTETPAQQMPKAFFDSYWFMLIHVVRDNLIQFDTIWCNSCYGHPWCPLIRDDVWVNIRPRHKAKSPCTARWKVVTSGGAGRVQHGPAKQRFSREECEEYLSGKVQQWHGFETW